MRRDNGFTLIELMVVVAILGIMSATALPLYSTFQQRTYGREAMIMSKQVIDAQIIYFLDHERFYPEDGSDINIFKNSSPDDTQIQEVYNNLHILIPVGHHLDYAFRTDNQAGDENFQITVTAAFRLFRGGITPGSITGSIDKNGQITWYIPGVSE